MILDYFKILQIYAILVVLVNDSTMSMSCLLITFCVTYVCTCHRLLNSQWSGYFVMTET